MQLVSEAPLILATASGKGGVGKSLLTTNLALFAAKQGKRVVIVDADFGGANVHNFLGLSYPTVTLNDFLSKRVSTLSKTALPAIFPGFWLISGDRSSFELANLPYQQKLKLLRHLKQLPVDYVFLDLGAGSAFNTLDFYNAADVQLLVTTPTQMSIDNMYHFLKTAIYRSLKQGLKNSASVCQKRVLQALDNSARFGSKSFVEALIDVSSEEDAIDWSPVFRILDQMQPQIIMNQVTSEKTLKLGPQISLACEQYFGIQTSYIGFLPKSKEAEQSVLKRAPVVVDSPDSAFVHELQTIYLQLQNFAHTVPRKKL